MADPLYVVAREVIILVGAQAIDLHTGDADMAVPAFTTDGDLLIEPAHLKPAPKIGDAMLDSGTARTAGQPEASALIMITRHGEAMLLERTLVDITEEDAGEIVESATNENRPER